MVLVTACGGNTSGPGGGGAGTVEQTCNDIAAVGCERSSTCTPFLFRVGSGDLSTCVQRSRASCVNAFAAPGTGLTPAAAAPCIAALRSISCTDLLRGATPAACTPIAGTRANGAACFEGSQCMSAFCMVAQGTTCGTCQPRPTAGGPCAANRACGAGLLCNPANVCVAPAQLGSPCSPPMNPCGAGLNCLSGTCQSAPAAVGAACTATNPCDFLQGVVCGPMMTCIALGSVAAGQSCGVVGMNLVVCTNSNCAGTSATMRQGTCQAYAADGAPCNTMAGPTCEPGLTCVPSSGAMGPGTCRRPGQPACM
jgi:hypothetical protein